MPHVALVTDSTCSLPDSWIRENAVSVVRLQVILDGQAYCEGTDGALSCGTLADALRSGSVVATSRPNPEEFLEVYDRLAAHYDEVVSIHLSTELSGTVESAGLAAAQAALPVRVVDAGQVGIGTGYAVMAAAEVRRKGGDAAAMARAAQGQAASTTSLFYVETLEYLRRGGRVSPAAARFGSVLAVKPILAVDEGRVVLQERVRTSTKALARLEELAVQAAGSAMIRLAVAHLANEAKAVVLAQHLTTVLGDRIAEGVLMHEIGPVLGAHAGPGMVAVCVARVNPQKS